MSKGRVLLVVAAAGALAAVLSAGPWFDRTRSGLRSAPSDFDARGASHVGAARCAACHPREHALWKGSHHDLAMQAAGPGTALGDFEGARPIAGDAAVAFARREGRLLARTQGPDGGAHEYEIAYTFGVTPLQQYLVALPGGRYQALTVAWDARPRTAGGGRWFSLYPGERLAPGDPLHWTGFEQTWNHQCAECHSTKLEKRYDGATHRYATTWAELNVACEACHGPGSRHVAWAEDRGRWWKFWREPDPGLTVLLRERAGVRWVREGAATTARRSVPRTGDAEIEVCARCHARRGALVEGAVPGQPLLDTHLPALLEPGLYHADGQQQGEVYIYGSFLQSRMYGAGVTCGDCHDPHSGRPRAPGNDVCARCHAADRFDAPGHHFHPAGSAGAACVGCHMPATTYMVIDPRRDHGFRVPRPDLTVELGTPNACTGCHADRPAAWARDRVRAWYGRDAGGFQRYARTLHAGRAGAPGALPLLADLARDAGQPAIARATGLRLLGRHPGPTALAALGAGVADRDPLVRRAALGALADAATSEQQLSLARPLLHDRLRAIRMEAGRLLAGVPEAALQPADQAARRRAIEEYVASQRMDADRPEARLNLGLLRAAQGRATEAESEYRAAIGLWRAYVPAYVNLADLHRVAGREGEAERVLSEGLAAAPGDAALHHALGLALVRQGRRDDGLRALARAAALAPDRARYAYVYAVGLHDGGRRDAAIAALEAALGRSPNDADLLSALAIFHRARGEPARARQYAERLAAVAPEDPRAAQVLRELGGEGRR